MIVGCRTAESLRNTRLRYIFLCVGQELCHPALRIRNGRSDFESRGCGLLNRSAPRDQAYADVYPDPEA